MLFLNRRKHNCCVFVAFQHRHRIYRVFKPLNKWQVGPGSYSAASGWFRWVAIITFFSSSYSSSLFTLSLSCFPNAAHLYDSVSIQSTANNETKRFPLISRNKCGSLVCSAFIHQKLSIKLIVTKVNPNVSINWISSKCKPAGLMSCPIALVICIVSFDIDRFHSNELSADIFHYLRQNRWANIDFGVKCQRGLDITSDWRWAGEVFMGDKVERIDSNKLLREYLPPNPPIWATSRQAHFQWHFENFNIICIQPLLFEARLSSLPHP